MKLVHASNFFLFLLLGLVFFCLAYLSAGRVLASTTDGTIPSGSYAWGENLGWINFGCDGCSARITDSAVTGYGWSHNFGWINFSPANGGVTNSSEGALGGYAWSAQKGWISMAGVTINSSGVFTGTAGTQGTEAGRINFSCGNCNVTTDWRPSSARGGSVILINQSPTTPTTPAAPETTPTAPEPTIPQTVDINSPEYKNWFIEDVKRTDFIQDGKIDTLDFNQLMIDWEKSGSGVLSDANQDNNVDITDFNLLMIYWGKLEIKKS